MNSNVLEELVEALLSSIEALETDTAATLQLLRAEGIASDEKLAPHLEQARAASSVRARATRVRLQHLIASASKEEERAAKKSQEGAGEEHHGEDAAQVSKTSHTHTKATQQAAELAKRQSKDTQHSERTTEGQQSGEPGSAGQRGENGIESGRKADLQLDKDDGSSPSKTGHQAA